MQINNKWWIVLALGGQGLIGGLVILLWFFRHEPLTLAVNRWLLTTPGHLTLLGLAAYLIVIAVFLIGRAITTQSHKQ